MSVQIGFVYRYGNVELQQSLVETTYSPKHRSEEASTYSALNRQEVT